MNGAGTLTTMEDGLGYWVYATVPDTLTVYGTQAGHPGPDYPVLSDWNMVGFTSTIDMALETYLATVAGNYSIIYHWNAGSWLWWQKSNPASTFTDMEPTYGYWLYLTSGGTITPP